jgi:hypothetical protein
LTKAFSYNTTPPPNKNNNNIIIMAKPLSVSDIMALFPEKTIEKISSNNERPSWQTINTAQLKLNANALTIDSTVGGGTKGHLFLLTSVAAYTTLVGTAYVLPVNPGPLPNYPPAASAAAINAATLDHSNAMATFRTSRNVDTALRNMLLELVEPQFLAPLHHHITGFGALTAIQILNHLHTTYGTITREQMKENLQLFNSDWSPPTPIETLFQRFKDCRSFATIGGNEINDVTTVDTGYDIILRGGMHTSACTDWRKLDVVAQTYVAFQAHFTKYEVDRLLVATSSSHGFAANAATAQKNDMAAAIQAAVQAAIQPLQQQLARANLAAAAPPAQAGANANAAIVNPNGNPNYCWTHGYIDNRRHHSLTCQNPAHGHRREATSANIMGGSTRVYTDADRRPRNAPPAQQ